MMLKPVIILAIATLLTACQSASMQQAVVPASANSGSTMAAGLERPRFSGTGFLNKITPKDFQQAQNISYGTDARQKLDIYRPMLVSTGNVPKPVIVFVHGGSWMNGSKDDYLFLGESLTKAGYITVVINYRLAPEHLYPDFVQDTALALKWVYANIGQYGGNPNKLIVMGHSAGGFNAVEAVDNQRWLQEAGVPVQAIKAVVGIAGPYSYDFRTDSTRSAFPANATPEQVMPSYHVRLDAPPHLLLVGSNDKRVHPRNAEALVQALQQKNIPVQLETIQGASHLSIMAAMATRLSWYKSTRQVVLDYLNKTVPN